MNIISKMNGIRIPISRDKKQIKYSIVNSFILGIVIGLLAKLLDSAIFSSILWISILGNVCSQLGLWVFIATLLAVYSYTAKLASIRVFVFFIAMLLSYYIYTILLLHFFPINQIIFWSIIALTSPIFAYIIWFSRGTSLMSVLLTASPISIILLEGYYKYINTIKYYENFYRKYQNYENASVSDSEYFYLIGTEIIYVCFIVVILLLIPKNKKQIFIIFPLAIILSFLLEKLDIFKILFTGMINFL